MKRLLLISFIKHQGEHNFFNTVFKYPLLYSQYVMENPTFFPLFLPSFQRVKKNFKILDDNISRRITSTYCTI